MDFLIRDIISGLISYCIIPCNMYHSMPYPNLFWIVPADICDKPCTKHAHCRLRGYWTKKYLYFFLAVAVLLNPRTEMSDFITKQPNIIFFCKLPQRWTFKWPSPACACQHEPLLEPAPLCAAFILHSVATEFYFFTWWCSCRAQIHPKDIVQEHNTQHIREKADFLPKYFCLAHRKNTVGCYK